MVAPGTVSPILLVAQRVLHCVTAASLEHCPRAATLVYGLPLVLVAQPLVKLYQSLSTLAPETVL